MIRPLTQIGTRLRTALVAVSAVAMVMGNIASAGAAALSSASVELSDPRPDQTSTYTVTASGFTTGTPIYCVEVDLDTQADGAGSNPTPASGTTSSTFDSSSLLTPTSWAVSNTTDGTLRITSVGGETPAANGNIVWGAVTNGATENTTYYALMTTFTDASCTGGNEVDTVVMAFTYTAGELVTLTIDPTLTFSVNSLGIGTSINGATTTIATTASAVDFGSAVTSSANGISGHRLDVSTNATGGYNVYIRHTADLTNSASDTITVWTGTNAAPTTFSAAGTEAWGYTTDDATLTGGTADRFTSSGGDKWAGFTTSNQPVMSNAVATAGTDQVQVAQQAGVAATTEAGTYNTTIIYTIVATY